MSKTNKTNPQALPENHSIEWLQCLELSYDTTTGSSNNTTPDSPAILENGTYETPEDGCFHCGETSSDTKKLSTCSKCQIAKYCSRDCQIEDWKTGSSNTNTTIEQPKIPHKHLCQAFRTCGTTLQLTTTDQKEQARNILWTSIRFYSCPYSVHHSQTLGRGFCFVQSPFTLNQIALPHQVYSKLYAGQQQQQSRNVLIHYLTLGEYDAELIKDDFELTSVRNTLTTLVNEYDLEKELVVMMRFRCGHVSVGIIRTIVPEHRICKSLGMDYFGNDSGGEGGIQALQLNLDDL